MNGSVSIDQWEESKENVLPLKEGRDPRALAAAFGQSPQDRARRLREERSNFEAELSANPSDPLGVWRRYAAWAQQSFTSDSSRAEVLGVLERVCKIDQAAASKAWAGDLRFLKLWILYADIRSEAAAQVFAILQENGIGQAHALLYEALAAHHEQHARYAEAEKAYRDGITRKVAPLDRLKRHFRQFLSRMAERARKGMACPAKGQGQAIATNDENAVPGREVMGTLIHDQVDSERLPLREDDGGLMKKGLSGAAGKRPELTQDGKGGVGVFADGQPCQKQAKLSERATHAGQPEKAGLSLRAEVAPAAETKKENDMTPAQWTTAKFPLRRGKQQTKTTTSSKVKTAQESIPIFVDEEFESQAAKNRGDEEKKRAEVEDAHQGQATVSSCSVVQDEGKLKAGETAEGHEEEQKPHEDAPHVVAAPIVITAIVPVARVSGVKPADLLSEDDEESVKENTPQMRPMSEGPTSTVEELVLAVRAQSTGVPFTVLEGDPSAILQEQAHLSPLQIEEEDDLDAVSIVPHVANSVIVADPAADASSQLDPFDPAFKAAQLASVPGNPEDVEAAYTAHARELVAQRAGDVKAKKILCAAGDEAVSLSRVLDAYRSAKRRLDEPLALYLAAEAMECVADLHRCDMLHCCLSTESLVLSFGKVSGDDDSSDGDWPEWQPGSLSWEGRGLFVGEVSSCVDLRAVGNREMVAAWPESVLKAQEDPQKPWRWDIDALGLCGVLHQLVFDSPLEWVSSPPKNEGEHSMRHLAQPVKRLWQVGLWTEVFDTLLNCPADLPLPLERLVSLVHDNLQADPKRSKAVRSLLMRLRIMLQQQQQ